MIESEQVAGPVNQHEAELLLEGGIELGSLLLDNSRAQDDVTEFDGLAGGNHIVVNIVALKREHIGWRIDITPRGVKSTDFVGVNNRNAHAA